MDRREARDYAEGWFRLALRSAESDGRGRNDHPTGLDDLRRSLDEELRRSHEDVEALGALIQFAAEENAEFNRTFAAVVGHPRRSADVNPFTVEGLAFIESLYRNGVRDDWEIFLAWREEGYVVVGEDARLPQDVRFGFRAAVDWLERRLGGFRPAPGEADVDALSSAVHAAPTPR